MRPAKLPKAHPHRGQARLRLRIGPKQYQEVYCGPWGTPEAVTEEARVVARWLATGSGTVFSTNGLHEPTVAVVAAAYLRHCTSYYAGPDGKPGKQFARIRRAFEFALALHGSTRADQFGPVAMAEVRQSMIGAGWCRRFINASVRAVMRAFRWAASQEMLGEEVYRRLHTLEHLHKGRCPGVPEKGKRLKPVPAEHIDACRAKVSPTVSAMIELQRWTGMRPGELVIVRGCDITQDGPTGTWVYRPPHFKQDWQEDREQDEIYLGPQARAVVRPFLEENAERPEAYLFSPWSARHARAHRIGEHYSVRTYCQAIEYGCVAAGVPVWTPRRLRHTAGERIRARSGLDGAQAVLRHRHASTTEIYAAVRRELAAKIMHESG